MRTKLFPLNLGTVIALSGVFSAAYYLLLYDNPLRVSLSSIIERSQELSVNTHLLVLGLIPIYIAIIIFGAATLGIYLGAILQQVLVKPLKGKGISPIKAKM